MSTSRIVESERRLDPPAEPPAHDVIRALLAAGENLERARARRAHAAPVEVPAAASNLLGAIHRLADARRAAEEFLKPSTGPLC